MSPGFLTVDEVRDSFPRVSGDEPKPPSATPTATKFSPRERG